MTVIYGFYLFLQHKYISRHSKMYDLLTVGLEECYRLRIIDVDIFNKTLIFFNHLNSHNFDYTLKRSHKHK